MKSGYTLPVFAIAAAKASILAIQSAHAAENQLIAQEIGTLAAPHAQPSNLVHLDLLEAGFDDIEISQCAVIDDYTALAIAISNPGDNLDLTSGTPIWAWVNLKFGESNAPTPQLVLEGGEGLGKTASGQPAIYQLARDLADVNLLHLLAPQTIATIRFILPEGRALAKRTSNAAFGILDGLSLLGTSAISKPLSVEDKLEEFRADLQAKAANSHQIAFYIGANGYQVAQRLGFTTEQLVQTANWIGAMLVEAALLGVNELTLIGYHGKLLKLAGGIFNTSSHLADARIDILVRAAVHEKLQSALIQEIESLPTAEAVHKLLVEHGCDRQIFQYLTDQITQRATAYVQKYTDRQIEIKTILCDRLGQLVV